MSVIPEIKLKPGGEQRLLDGGCWVFRNELDLQQKDQAPGSWARLISPRGRPMAVGFLNTRASLSFRSLARSGELPGEEDPRAVILARLKQALALRQDLGLDAAARRLVFSEGDHLPGLVVDQFGEALVMQVGAAGFEGLKPWLAETLRELTGCRALVERSEGPAREREGLEDASGLLWAAPGFEAERLGRWAVAEQGLTFSADLLKGQKTGFFLDQRQTRATLRSLAQGRRCLDAFCHTGSLSVAMAAGGACAVLGLDSSEPALDLARANAEGNGVADRVSFEAVDCFERLRSLAKAGERFGLVLLDPPAMTKGKEGLEGALRGYKELNLRALQMLEPGGFLATCSCTQAVDEERFLRQVAAAARDARVELCQTHLLRQPPDHPWIASMPETRYLKAAFFRRS
jgi:23S rRNA (cytosine1962-C5)-methyltransferase